VHGLWLLPSSWDRWATLFEQAGYVALTPEWPDDAGTVAEANAHPEVFARKSIGQIAEHFAEVIGGLAVKPVVIGHSFGGLLAQILAGRGLATASHSPAATASAHCRHATLAEPCALAGNSHSEEGEI
jgi:non-heme chloroperoxidase